MCNIIKGGTYRIKTDGDYFEKNYGEKNPLITIEDTDKNVFGDRWQNRQYVPAVTSFILRFTGSYLSKHKNDTAYYGKVKSGGFSIGELVFKHELEKIN